ncbi:iron ABC transporter permease [Acetobacter sp. AN02]|uniref:FecCD family ABC transporter permease n=1 Tax=Acetobacter sp. AN02 TaxID=2894186 RepID=UPI0024344526|nr:iron ABC transporter permease [Acetobacter sp. AN02]MDG6093806.1 iron ABC transporter permease [Acetobacter sp. AN02]
MTRIRAGILAGLICLLAVFFVSDLSFGPLHLSFSRIATAVFGSVPDQVHMAIWQIRLPGACLAILTGFALGLSGSEMQTILNNPLASPFTLGVSAAAAFGASLALILGWHLPGISSAAAVPANAFVFAVGSALLLNVVSRSREGEGVVLFGIALVFTFQACVALLQFVASEDTLQDLVFWTMGSVTRATWPRVICLGLACLITGILSFRAAPALTMLRLGDDRAAGLGIDARRVRFGALLRVSVLASLAVAFSGTIGFVGLVAPHISRHLFGEDHRWYLPGGALAGALIMSAASVTAKNTVPGQVLPVGIVTALAGVPFFIAVVLRRRGDRGE